MSDQLPNFEGDVGRHLEAQPIIAFYADGALASVPAGSTNGTALNTATARPLGASGVEINLPAGSSITYTIATAQPTGAPSATVTVSGDSFASWPIALGPGSSVYVTAVTGALTFRWI